MELRRISDSFLDELDDEDTDVFVADSYLPTSPAIKDPEFERLLLDAIAKSDEVSKWAKRLRLGAATDAHRVDAT